MTRKYKAVLIDIDNTLTRLQPTLDSMSEHLELTNITEEEATSFYLAECYEGVTKKEERAFWETREADNCATAELAEDRVESIYENYIDEDTEIHIVTARKGHLLDITKDWLKKTGLMYHSLHCVGWQSKLKWIEKNLPQIEAIFEDNPSLFVEAFEDGHDKEIDFYKIDYPYNVDVPAHYILDRETGKELISIKKEGETV